MESANSFNTHLAVRFSIPDIKLEKAALSVEKGTCCEVAEALVESGIITEQQWLEEFHQFYGLELVDLEKTPPDRELTRLVSPGFVNENSVVPVRVSNGTLFVATPLPLNLEVFQDLCAATGMAVKPLLARRGQVTSAIRAAYGVGAETAEKMLQGEGAQLEVLKPDQDSGDLREMADAAPVVRFVDQIILEAFRDRATDIHIEPFEKDLRIRYRIDGVLFEVSTPPGIQHFHAALISRIKIMATMDIAEKRLPQDGRIKLRVAGEELDLRVATLPTSKGETISIRLLRRHMILMDISDLGIREDVLQRIRNHIDSPHGMILVTGPTGGGKTTTLYSFLNRVNSPERKIVTIEDPVEYDIPGITQVQIRPRIDLTFANGLRSMLRHDPDVIMVGEMRDQETARMGIQAALTGHLVFSTLHTNDAPGAITRLNNMGVMPYLIASSLRAVIAQRLVRALCPMCREKYSPEPAILEQFGVSKTDARATSLWRGAGCDNCHRTGFRGRLGLFEVLEVNREIRNLINENASQDAIRSAATRAGMTSLLEDGWVKIRQGLTTPEEVLKAAREEGI